MSEHLLFVGLNSSDHGRLLVVHVSKHSLFSWYWNFQLCCGLCCVCVVCCCLVGWLVGLRVVLQELEQDDVEVVAPRPESKHVETCKTKAQIWAKGTTQRAIHRTKKTVIQKKYPARDFISLRL